MTYPALPFQSLIRLAHFPLSGIELLCHDRTELLPTRRYVNSVATSRGCVRAVCQFCGRRSRPTTPDRDGEPGLFTGRGLGRGWSEAPYPHTHRHDDGSVGSTFTCPPCNKRLDAGEALRLRSYDPLAKFGSARRIA